MTSDHSPDEAAAEAREVAELRERYAGYSREQLCGGQFSDFEVAFKTAMLCRDDLDHESVLLTAKDRIRWLSVQNDLKDAALTCLRGEKEEYKAKSDALCHDLLTLIEEGDKREFDLRAQLAACAANEREAIALLCDARAENKRQQMEQAPFGAMIECNAGKMTLTFGDFTHKGKPEGDWEITIRQKRKHGKPKDSQ